MRRDTRQRKRALAGLKAISPCVRKDVVRVFPKSGGRDVRVSSGNASEIFTRV